MKIEITGCQKITDKGQIINSCPFCHYIQEWGGSYLKCQLQVNLRYYSSVVLNFIPEDCVLKTDDIIITGKS